MKRAYAVIGANYGDEGKGLLTDYLASRSPNPEKCLVVRYNGGAQAGHTVLTPNERRHVFSHFGSGSFLGCPTYLSRFFIVNPMLFAKELAELKGHNLRPRVMVDHLSFLSTPFDVMINQIVESARSSQRHGSCGVGINETVTRCLADPAWRTQVKDMLNPKVLEHKLVRITEKWFPSRLKAVGIDPESNEHAQTIMLNADSIIARYLTDVDTFLSSALVSRAYPKYSEVIFEGAQGLMLDEDRLDQWPHVTRSKTGLDNVVYLAKQMELERLEVTYVTRTYLTKHGAGPLLNECEWKFNDCTNVPNTFQGTLRFAPLDIRQLNDSVCRDIRRARLLVPNVTAGMAITWTDQLPCPDQRTLCIPISFVSCGPTRKDVEPVRLRATAGSVV